MSTPLTILAAVLALLALAALGQGVRMALGGALAAPREAQGVVVAHAPISKEVVVGGRGASRRDAAFTRVTVEYDAAGAKRTLHFDRAPELAARDFPVGARVSVWFRSARPGDGSLEPDGFALFSAVLLTAGCVLLGSAALVFVLGRKT